jgi:BirA family transcriptional regulator, biotin operon repressor / biotin---[acetyl-CoA-carboxylase] ligase
LPHTPLHKPPLSSFIELQSVDSTNNYARRLINEGLARHGMAVFAHQQTAGKGQRNKRWISEPGANIILSIIIRPESLQVSQIFPLSVSTILAVYELFSKYAGDRTSIKWPNDLYWQDRKAGGILIENIISGQKDHTRETESEPARWLWSILGIGININQTSFPSELENPVSMKQITGDDHDPIGLANELCSIVNERYAELTNGGFTSQLQLYNSHLYKKGLPVKLKQGSRNFEAVIDGVNTEGQLVARHAIEEKFSFGEIEWTGR